MTVAPLPKISSAKNLPHTKATMKTSTTLDSDVASWLQPSPRRYSKEWKVRKSRKAQDESPVIEDAEQAEEEILAISPPQQGCSESGTPESQKPTPRPKPQKEPPQKLPLALRRLSAHNEAVIR